MLINGVANRVESENDGWGNSAQSYAKWMKAEWE
jgi:hypothetical protein